MRTPTTLGFACRWDRQPAGTWSGTPWNLRRALREQVSVDDIDVGPPTAARAALKAAYLRRSQGEWKSLWRHSTASNLLVEHALRRNAARSAAAVVVQVQDLGSTPQPFMVVQDLSYQLLLEKARDGVIPHFRTLRLRRVQQLHERQLELYSRAAHLLPMSSWLAKAMVSSGVPQHKITVVNPGVNVAVEPSAPVSPRRRSPIRRLLLVGRDFHTKAGDVVVAAFGELREQFGPGVELTVIGPPRWPLPGAVPAGVDFRGPASTHQVAAALDSHDLFVMPSRFEGFGIAFVEALIRGLPCIGRRACAMPEIIDDRSGGRLVDSDDPHALAELIVRTLDDDALFEACSAAAPARRAHYSWDRAAAQVIEAAALG